MLTPAGAGTNILVLGLGNELYGDDGAGLLAVRRLEREWTANPPRPTPGLTVAFEACPLSGAALLDVVRGADALLIIDTILRDEPVTGRVSILDGADIRDLPGPSPHYISVPQTLALGRSIGLHMPGKVTVVAVEAKNLYRLGEGLTAEMEAALPAVVAAARAVLEGWAAGLRGTCP
jgi:hydrogenase maturation protease